MKTVLSICIPTFNHCDRIFSLVNEIFKIKSDKLFVVVVDNCSTDNTIGLLSSIKDPRLHVYKNDKNLAAKINWYTALEYGTGKYICHLNDTDYIYSEKLQKLIEILESSEFDFAFHSFLFPSYVLGNKKLDKKDEYFMYNSLEQKLLGFGWVATHPSGVIFKTESWKKIKDRYKYFSEDYYGIYPHGFIWAEMALNLNGSGAYFCDNYFYSLQPKTVSAVYGKKSKKNYFWMPEENLRELSVICEQLKSLKIALKLKEKILIQRFAERLYFSTVLYCSCESTKSIASHYQFKAQHIFIWKLVLINWNFTKMFLNNLKDFFPEYLTDSFKKQIKKVQKKNYIWIIRQKLRLL